MNKSHLHLIVLNDPPIRSKPRKRDPLIVSAGWVVAWTLLCGVIWWIVLK